jgi:anti-sigma factor RsiW
MTACAEWKDRLLDSALGVPTSQDLAEHLKTCAACSETLIELRAHREQMDAGLRKLVRGMEAPPAFRARLMVSLEARRARRAAWLVPVGVLAAVVVVVALGAILTPSVKRWAGRNDSTGVSVSGSALWQWRSPTEVLLRSAADEYLRSSPRLGQFYLPMKSTRPATDADGRKWRNP